MEIRFISSLTAEDENMFAPALLKAVGALLDQLPIAYTMRIETTGSQVFQHTHALTEATEGQNPKSFGVNGSKLAYYVSRAAASRLIVKLGPGPSGSHLTAFTHTKSFEPATLFVSPAFFLPANL